MRKENLFLVVAFLATIFFIACKGNEPKEDTTIIGTTPEEIGVLINGVVWAPGNVDLMGTFVSKTHDEGKWYQWNIKDLANYLYPTEYNASAYAADTVWLPENDPSPEGWRIPTIDEFKTLFDTEKVKNEWVLNGRRFTDISTGKSIFLPAAGYSYYTSYFNNVGGVGKYWSRNKFEDISNFAYNLCFDENEHSLRLANNHKSYSMSIRPVAK